MTNDKFCYLMYVTVREGPKNDTGTGTCKIENRIETEQDNICVTKLNNYRETEQEIGKKTKMKTKTPYSNCKRHLNKPPKQ